MHVRSCLCLLSLFAACEDMGIMADSKPGKKDGAVRLDGRRDAGPGTDVVIGNEAGKDSGPTADTGTPPDACVPPASCGILFSYPKGSESKVELAGDFNGWKGVAMTLAGNTWQTTVTLKSNSQVLYKFVLDGTTWVSDPQNPKKTSDGYGNSILDVACPSTCVKPDSGPAPDSGPTTAFDWRDGVIYFVLVDRFSDGDKSNNSPEAGVENAANWQGGDLKGVLDKIQAGYFTGLGVNVLWLSSPVDAPAGKYIGDDGHYYTGYHGYWPTELDKVEERIGDLALLQQVVSEAHKQNIKVILDYVMNHVHDSSPTYKSNGGWFWSLQYGGKECVCGGGCTWDFSPEKERCWFRSYLPDFNFTVQAARGYSVANAIKWAKDSGADGFRLDAVKHIELSWLTDLRTALNQQVSRPQKFYLVGETYTNDKGLIKQYINPSSMLDGQFDFPLRATLVRTILMRQGTFYDLESFLSANDGYYGSGSIMGTFIGNHDLPRIVNLAEDTPQFGDWDSGKSRAWNNLPWQPSYDRAYQRVGVAFAALLTLPGIPLIYYGDEIGLAGGGDPDNRRFMQWSGTSTHQDALRALVSKLTKIRAAHPALRQGTRKQVWLGNDVYAYELTSGGDKLVVVLNRSDVDQTIKLQGSSYTDLLNGGTVAGSSLTTPARTARILQ